MNQIERFNGKCFNCRVCNGIACAGILPGMGGCLGGKTFQNNFTSWEEIEVHGDLHIYPEIGIAPMTGVSENVGGFLSERDFQHSLAKGAKNQGIFYCAGDGAPDFKLHYSLEAMSKYSTCHNTVFLKPYPFEEIIRRMTFLPSETSYYGIDIDSANLINLKGKVSLEEKGWEELLEIKKISEFPFVLKGIYSENQIEMIEKVRPHAVVISNHGGRVFDNGEGTAYLLKRLFPEIRRFVSEIWVDGGLRTSDHIRKAGILGANKVLIGRPFAVEIILDKENGVRNFLEKAGICIQR